MLNNQLFVLECEVGLEQIVIDEVNFRCSLADIPVPFKVETCYSQPTGFVRLLVEHQYTTFNNKHPEIFKKIFHVIKDTLTAKRFFLSVNSVPLRLLGIENVDKISRELDFFRLKEEIAFTLQQIKIIPKLPKIGEITIQNVSTHDISSFLDGNTKKQINDILLKSAAGSTIWKRKDSEVINQSLSIIISKDMISFGIMHESLLFCNRIPNRLIKRHQTPLSPDVAAALVLKTFRRLREKPNLDRRRVIVLDPFCGFGTICNIAACNAHFLKDWAAPVIQKSADTMKIQIIGTDSQEKSIENANENLQLLRKEHGQDADVEFITIDIESLRKSHERYLGGSFVILIISQPPYGFTINLDEKKLRSLYRSFLKLDDEIATQREVIASFVTGRKDLVLKLTRDYQITAEIQKKGKKYAIFEKKNSS